MSDLNKLKELIFESDNNACFIERERILNRLEKEMADYDAPDKYAVILAKLLAEVSVPIYECDYFAGRVVEAFPDKNMKAPNELLSSTGHMNPDYATLLKAGLKGILDNIKSKKKSDEESKIFVKNAEIVVNAIRDYATRYSAEAEKKGYTQMAEALKTVPYEPAYDLFSALQSIWLIHMIASCYVGSRDYAFGRFDEYMLPFYEKSISDGMSENDIEELVAGFFVKTNEICGRSTYNYKCKPILSQASKQYVNIGGEKPNKFSETVLKAAVKNNMAQPQITVLLKTDANESFTSAVFEAMSVLVDKLHVYNYDLILSMLLKKGIEEDVAKEFTYSACCTFDLNYHSYRLEYYVPVPQIFLKVLKNKEYTNIDDIINDFKQSLKNDIQNDINRKENRFRDKEYARKNFVLDGLLLTDSTKECRYPCGCSKYTVFNCFCPGIATIGDSLMVLDKLVFKEKRYTYKEFIQILNNNFENNEELRQQILKCVKFGNDTDADNYTVTAANAFIDAIDMLNLKNNRYAVGGFYSLANDNLWKDEVGATPDGRRTGDAFSENQSPTYGADKSGITALLKSIAKLPFYKTAAGGLNITFSQHISSNNLKALVVSYFSLGGFHIGISVIDAETLRKATEAPEKYKSLTVRLYGFSEYFISLPKWQQTAVLNRTIY